MQSKTTVMKKILYSLIFICCPSILIAQQYEVRGKVTDEQRKPLPGATVNIKGSSTTVVTDNDGDFSCTTKESGLIRLIISYVGYETSEISVEVVDGLPAPVAAILILDTKAGNDIVVSASKRPEKITNAPASIHVIGIKDVDQFAGSNVGELVSRIQGVEYTRNGLTEINFNARGLNSAFNNKVFQIVDGRNSMSALSASLPVMNRGTTIKDDIERLEIILGPQSALYGPNAHNAVFNTITKDPRKYQGTTVALSAGSRYQFSGRIRQAAKINNKWAYKLTGEYAIGREFNFYDSVYAGNQPPRLQGPFGPAVAIPERINDFNFRHLRGEAHAFYSVSPKSDIIVSRGASNNNWLQVTTSGRNQMRGVTYSFLQARFVHPHFFANIYNTWGSLGTSYSVGNYTRDFWNITNSTATSGANRRLPADSAEIYALRNRFKEESQRINAELQYNYTFKKQGLFIVAGMNYQKEQPNGFGITLLDSFNKIKVTQYGAVFQLDKSLPWGARLISTTRLDKHDNFGIFVSPRFALLKKIGDGNFRITWGRAYAMPSIQNQYAGIGRNLFGNGGGITYIRTNTKFNDPNSISSTMPLKPEQISTWEIGYKGTLAKKLFIDVNYYNGLSKNFISPTRSISGRVLTVNGVPVTHNPATAGAIINDTLRSASFSTFLNYGNVRAYGLDLGLTYTFSKFVNAAVKYSWFGSDITKDNAKNDANVDGYVSLEEKSMNAPGNRGMLILNFQNLCKEKVFINLSARYVEKYDFYSANQIGTAAGEGSRGRVYGGMLNGQPRTYLKNYDWGPLGGFTTIDLAAGYRINEQVRLNMGITNVFNTKQVEFVGSPSISRLFMFEMRMHIPNSSSKK